MESPNLEVLAADNQRLEVDSFIRYQKLIQREFSDLQQQYDFTVVNGNLSVRAISHEINRRVAEIL